MRGLLKGNQNILYRHEGSSLARTDKKLLRNILINLVNNAIKFSGEGMPIEVNSVINNGKITISVADKGIGISKDDQTAYCKTLSRSPGRDCIFAKRIG